MDTKTLMSIFPGKVGGIDKQKIDENYCLKYNDCYNPLKQMFCQGTNDKLKEHLNNNGTCFVTIEKAVEFKLRSFHGY